MERPKQFSEFYESLNTAAGVKPPSYPPGGIFGEPVVSQSQTPKETKAWVPPRDKWNSETNQKKPAPAWTPPRDKWQDNGSSQVNSAAASSATPSQAGVNPFVEVPDSYVAPSDNRVPEYSPVAEVTADESFFSEEADESEEFVV